MSIELEEPVAVGRVPVILVSIEDYSGIVADAVTTHQRLERPLVHEVAADRVLHVDMPVQLDGTRNVSHRLVEQWIFVGFYDPHLRIIQMGRHPGRIYQHFRMSIT